MNDIDKIIEQVDAVYNEAIRLQVQSLSLKAKVAELKLQVDAWEKKQPEPHAWRKLMQRKKTQTQEVSPKLPFGYITPSLMCKCGARCVRRNEKDWCLDCMEYVE